MGSLLATKRRAKEFARLLDGSRTTHDPTLARLVGVARRLRPGRNAEPDPSFRDELRGRVMAAARVASAQRSAEAAAAATDPAGPAGSGRPGTAPVSARPGGAGLPATPVRPTPPAGEFEPVAAGRPVLGHDRPVRLPAVEIAREALRPRPPVIRRPRLRRLVIAGGASALVLVTAVAGIAALARQAVPGDLLYGLKRDMEQTQQAISTSPESLGEQYLAAGQARLNELDTLARSSSSGATGPAEAHRAAAVRSTLQDFTQQSRRGGDLLLQAYRSDKNTQPLVRLRAFTDQSAARLGSLEPMLPRSAGPAVVQATDVLDSLSTQVRGLCSTCDTSTRSRTGTGRSTDTQPGTPAPLPSSTQGPSATPTPSAPTPGPTSTIPPSRSPLPGPTQSPPAPGPRTPSPTPTKNPPPPPLPLPLPIPLPLPLPL